MQQETIQPEHSEQKLTHEQKAPKSVKPLPYGRLETILTMVGVQSVVFLAMLVQMSLVR